MRMGVNISTMSFRANIPMILSRDHGISVKKVLLLGGFIIATLLWVKNIIYVYYLQLLGDDKVLSIFFFFFFFFILFYSYVNVLCI